MQNNEKSSNLTKLLAISGLSIITSGYAISKILEYHFPNENYSTDLFSLSLFLGTSALIGSAIYSNRTSED